MVKQIDKFNWEVWNGSRMVRIGGHSGQYTAVAYVDNGNVATTRSTTVKTINGAIRWAKNWLHIQ